MVLALKISVAIAFLLMVAGTRDRLISPAQAAARSHTFASFVTPGQAAYCKFYPPELFDPFKPASDWNTGFECWTPNDGFTVRMRATTRPKKAYVRANKWHYARSIGSLPFGHAWWASNFGLVADDYGNIGIDYREGKGRPRGRVLYRCWSRASGLTCKNRAGHGWWLGRYRGYRLF